MAYDAANCEFVRLASPEIDERLKSGPELVSANFVIPYPPGFPIMVPGQVITTETIAFMRKLDVKEIHGYHAEQGLKLLTPPALAAHGARTRRERKGHHESLVGVVVAMVVVTPIQLDLLSTILVGVRRAVRGPGAGRALGPPGALQHPGAGGRRRDRRRSSSPWLDVVGGRPRSGST